ARGWGAMIYEASRLWERFTGWLSRLWKNMESDVARQQTIADMWRIIAYEATRALNSLWQGIKDIIGNKIKREWEALKGEIEAVADKFRWLYNVVVGHSYVPDMVKGVTQEFGKLPGAMEGPTRKAVMGVSGSLRSLSSMNSRRFVTQAGQDMSDFAAKV